MVPSAGPPGSDVSLLGTTTWQLQQDCGENKNWVSTYNCTGAVLLGDYMCSSTVEDGAPSFEIATITLPRDSGSRYRVRGAYGLRFLQQACAELLATNL